MGEELAKYKLLLSPSKTKIIPLPQTLKPEWATALALMLPRSDRVNDYDAVNYLDFAVQLAKAEPDGSVLKYALKSLLGKKLVPKAKVEALRYALTLSFHQPALLPLLQEVLRTTAQPGKFPYASELQDLVWENARHRRSDGMVWALHYANLFHVPIEKATANQVALSRDCLALLLLYLSGNPAHQATVIDFANGLDASDLYELFLAGKIASPYKDEDAFETLKSCSVAFVKAPR